MTALGRLRPVETGSYQPKAAIQLDSIILSRPGIMIATFSCGAVPEEHSLISRISFLHYSPGE